MYLDLLEVFWYNEMKRDVVIFLAKCPNCQQVKVEHEKPQDVNQDMNISTREWEVINMDFITNLPHTRRQYETI